MAERWHVARVEGWQQRSRYSRAAGMPKDRERLAAGWHDGCHMLVRSAGNEATELSQRARERKGEEGGGEGKWLAQKMGFTSKTIKVIEGMRLCILCPCICLRICVCVFFQWMTGSFTAAGVQRAVTLSQLHRRAGSTGYNADTIVKLHAWMLVCDGVCVCVHS